MLMLDLIDQSVVSATRRYNNDIKLLFGDDSDIAVLHRSTSLAADTELTDVIEGTSNHPGVAANSLIIANITDDGDILFVVSDGGNSRGLLKLDGDVGRVLIATGASSPAPDSLLHVWSGDASQTANVSALITIESSAGPLLQFLGGASSQMGLIFGDSGASNAGLFGYRQGSDRFEWEFAGQAGLFLTTAALSLNTAGLDLDINAGYLQLSEMTAPGAGAANHVRIYAEDDGGGLTDLSAVFQDGTIIDFAAEVTPLDAPIHVTPSRTTLTLEFRKPHPGVSEIVAVFPDGRTHRIWGAKFHDRAKIDANAGGVDSPLPDGWVVETTVQRAARVKREKPPEPKPAGV